MTRRTSRGARRAPEWRVRGRRSVRSPTNSQPTSGVARLASRPAAWDPVRSVGAGDDERGRDNAPRIELPLVRPLEPIRGWRNDTRQGFVSRVSSLPLRYTLSRSTMKARSRASRLLLPAFVSAMLLAGPVGCHPQRTGTAESTVPIVFANETIDKADVWIFATDLPRRRLGTVLGGETTTLRAPRTFFARGYILIEAEQRGRQSASVDLYNANPDDELRVRLP